MTFAILYWILMLIWVIFGVWTSWPNKQLAGGNVLLFVLLLILGWQLFGAPVQG